MASSSATSASGPLPEPPAPSTRQLAAQKTTGVLDYVQKAEPPETLSKLYGHPQYGRHVCKAVLQRCSHLAQQAILRLDSAGGSFSLSGIGVSGWYRNEQETAEILKELQTWNIVLVEARMVSLNPQFKAGLRDSLIVLDSSPWTPLTAAQIDAICEASGNEKIPPVTVDDLDRHTQQKWDSIMHYMVGTEGHREPPPSEITQFLLETGLMQTDPENEDEVVISTKGYDFMLWDHTTQMWHFLCQYLSSMPSDNRGDELRLEALVLMICLSFGRVGEAYHGSALTKSGRRLVQHWAMFGLLYTRKIGKQLLFYPTRVSNELVENRSDDVNEFAGASSYALSSSALTAALENPRPGDSAHLAIIVQTNFEVCAFTTSELHVRMLGLFCDLKTIRRLPNVMFLTISRESVKYAFALGIQAKQILRFLEKHAHPNRRSDPKGPVPSNVVDQIWLWDGEQTRVVFTEVYQHECQMTGEFQAVQKYAMDHKVHLWSSERQKQILVDYSCAERVQQFVRQWHAEQGAR